MSILKKLKIEDKEIYVVNQPGDYDLFIDNHKSIQGSHDIIFAFVEDVDGFINIVQSCLNVNGLNNAGYLFVAYPKKGNKKYKKFVHRDEIFPALKVMEDGYIEGTDYKFNRMVAMDEVFTVVGIKHLPNRVVSKAASQCVADYEDQIQDILPLLNEDVVQFFESLTPGYKRDWARYVFSAKQEKTKLKRIDEMNAILAEGYKSKELFRQKKK
ncbi:YdeI/OmpD-associated family protein [Macrococcus animalis]|uniref:YdeI/OmpD-associated family protein n=1 Tax=Macrococcus animalis TaxID=3395467 RepID=UPI0039BEAA30